MNNLFPILSVETSGGLCSVAVIFNESKYVELNYLQKHIHSQKLIDMVDSILRNAGISLNDCKSVAVSMGPGSFTGLRIGLSAVKGLIFGANLPVIPVPTFEAFAFHISQFVPDNSKFIIVVNASIDEYYFSRFVKAQNNVKVIDALRLVEKNNLKSLITQNELVFGHEPIEGSRGDALSLSAYSIGRWAYLFGNDLLTFDCDYLEPNYFKNFIVKVRS